MLYNIFNFIYFLFYFCALLISSSYSHDMDPTLDKKKRPKNIRFRNPDRDSEGSEFRPLQTEFPFDTTIDKIGNK